MGRPETVQSGPGEKKTLNWRIHVDTPNQRFLVGGRDAKNNLNGVYIYAICTAKWGNVTYRKPLIWRIYIRHFNSF